MKMIIVGAGASYDSTIINADLGQRTSQHSIWRPPLGKELFGFNKELDDVLKKYPGALSFRSEISVCQDIEELFQNKYEQSVRPNGGTLLMQILNTQFYLQDLFYNISNNYVDFGTSNYDLLVTRAYDYYLLTNEKVLFVSFNYDTLLERAIESKCNLKFKGVNDYIDSPLIVIKPHGSCNWVKPVAIGDNKHLQQARSKGFANYLYEPKNLEFVRKLANEQPGSFSILEKPLDLYRKELPQTDIMYLPQLLIPLITKDAFVCPHEHISALSGSIEKITDVLIIGWKANEQYFMELMREQLTANEINILCVCGSTDIKSKLLDVRKDLWVRQFSEPFKNDEYGLHKQGTFSSFMLNDGLRSYNFFAV